MSKINGKIDEIQPTKEKISSRTGLNPFIKYLRNNNIDELIKEKLGFLKKIDSGVPVKEIYLQLIVFFLAGDKKNLNYFSIKKSDETYARLLDYKSTDDLISTDVVKRIFKKHSYTLASIYRKILQNHFIWKLKKENPEIITIDIDTVLFDNSYSKKKEGVSYTYKKGVKGFNLLMAKWNSYVIDTVFRGGKKHSNNKNTTIKTINHLLKKIHKEYKENIPIVFTLDSGFYDKKIFNFLEKQKNVYYVVTGKKYSDIKKKVKEKIQNGDEKLYKKKKGKKINKWKYMELKDKRGTWDKQRRAIYTRQFCDDNQKCLFSKKDRIYYTNLNDNNQLLINTIKDIESIDISNFISCKNIIKLAHKRGESELVHRHIKEYWKETFPFKYFQANMGFCYTMLISFNLYESYKRRICKNVIKSKCYPNIFRRKLIDFAGKIIDTGRKTILKVPEKIIEKLNLKKIFKQVQLSEDIIFET